MEIRKREIYRYLGYRNQLPDETTKQMIDEIVETLQKQCSPQSISRLFSCSIAQEKVTLSDGQEEIIFHSSNLAANLKGCKQVVLFAATLGNAPDQLVRKYEITNMAKAAIVQAAAAAYIEAYCNTIQEQIRVQQQEHGLFLRPRFSPGYGDLSLSSQRDIFKILSCEKRIGLTLTDSLLMLPTKSVTAVIGLTTDNEHCHIGKCKQCMNKDCEFRDEDTE